MFRGKKWLKKRKTVEQIIHIRSEASKKGWRTRKRMITARRNNGTRNPS